MKSLPCIVCQKPLLEGYGTRSPVAGCTFRRDEGELHEKVLEVNICATCMMRASERGHVYELSNVYEVRRWFGWDRETEHTLRLANEEAYGSAWGEDEPYSPAYDDVPEADDQKKIKER